MNSMLDTIGTLRFEGIANPTYVHLPEVIVHHHGGYTLGEWKETTRFSPGLFDSVSIPSPRVIPEIHGVLDFNFGLLPYEPMKI